MNYKEILQNVLENGQPKQAVRFDANNNPIPVENGTIGTFCEIFRHDMSEGFPLTTLRKMPFKSMCVELEGFIKGITDKSWYKGRGCKFWDEWCNPTLVEDHKYMKEFSYDGTMSREEADKEWNSRKKAAQKEINDLGPIYGYQWMSFNEFYGKASTPGDNIYDNCREQKASPLGTDQLKSIVDKLKTNPYDRRMICSAWNPNQMPMMALPPCHWGWNVVVYGNRLNLVWHQRSVCSSHGLPNNIASYALLLLLLCEESSLKPGELVGTLADCHLYTNTIEPAKILVSRNEKELPNLKIKRKEDNSFSIFKWNYTDVELIGYNPHPKLDMGKVTV